jgi:hypothetical protein
MNKYLLSASLIALLSSCASNPQLSSDQLRSEKEDSEKICRSEKVMGSKIPQTFCYTKDELEMLEEKSKKVLGNEQRKRERMKTLGGLKPE